MFKLDRLPPDYIQIMHLWQKNHRNNCVFMLSYQAVYDFDLSLLMILTLISFCHFKESLFLLCN